MKPTEQEIEQFASSFAKRCDPLNQTLEKQADLRQGYKAGFQKAISLQPEWVAITNKSDLPKEFCEAYFFDKPSQSIICGSFRPTKDEINFLLANARHYMIIERPQPPTK